MSAPRWLIVGIGSPHGDDQVGWLVADKIAALVDRHDVLVDRHDVNVRKAKSPTDLLDWLHDVDRLVICDACQGMGEIGAFRRWNWPDPALHNVTWSGTHDLGLSPVLEIAQRLGRLPDDVVVWGIEGEARSAMGALSKHVADAATEVIQGMLRELAG